MTNTSIELQKIREIREYNQTDNKPFSNYAMDVYERSLVKDIKKINRRKRHGA